MSAWAMDREVRPRLGGRVPVGMAGSTAGHDEGGVPSTAAGEPPSRPLPSWPAVAPAIPTGTAPAGTASPSWPAVEPAIPTGTAPVGTASPSWPAVEPAIPTGTAPAGTAPPSWPAVEPAIPTGTAPAGTASPSWPAVEPAIPTGTLPRGRPARRPAMTVGSCRLAPFRQCGPMAVAMSERPPTAMAGIP